MAIIRPFACVRPKQDLAAKVAALPYDVYNRKEAYEEVQKEPLSFLSIDRPETAFDETVDTYADCVYEYASERLNSMIREGVFETEGKPCYYIYELTMDGRSQTGIVACASIDDYENNIIKKHENTREEKELDRIRHVDTCSAQTGPIFLAYRRVGIISTIINESKKNPPLYSFTSPDQVKHQVWIIEEKENVQVIGEAFEKINEIYIADGHHRAASAVKVGRKRRNENPWYTGTEEFNYFLSVLFPDNELKILAYNRAVKDLNGLSEEEFLTAVKGKFVVTPKGKAQVTPERKGSFGMYLNGNWYLLEAHEELLQSLDPVKCLDVSILQDHLLQPILGIHDPRVDKRIDFIGGIRGLNELESRVDEDMKVAFSMYPTSIGELFSVSDAGKLMPPKSTWFEPKLRSGLFIHKI